MEINDRKNIIWPLWIKYKYFNRIPDWISTSFYFAIPALIIFTPFIFNNWDTLIQNEFTLYLKLFFGGLWVLYGPLFMFRYDKIYLRFWEGISTIYIKDDLKKQINYYDNQIIKLSRWISIVWCSMITSVLIIDPSYLKIFGIEGWSDPYLYIFILLMIYLIHLTALGFTGSFITIKIILSLIKSDSVRLNEYDSDSVGGFSSFGNFSLSTTILFSTGVLFIPILYDYAIHSGIIVQLLIFSAVILYGISIVLVFIIPVTLAFKKAEKDKDELINSALIKYKEYRNSGKNAEELNTFNYLNYLNGLTTYPFNFNNLFKISMTALFPIVLYFTQMLLDPGSILYNWKEVLEKIGIN